MELNAPLLALADRLRLELDARERREREQRKDLTELVPDAHRRGLIERYFAANPPPPYVRPVVEGCSDEAIAEIAAAQGVRLPLAYVEFLAVMGNGAGNLYTGSEWLYPLLLELKGWAMDTLLEAKSSLILPDTAAVVWMHQGYQFAWMSADDGDDPPVWYWSDATGAPSEPKWASWLDFLIEGEAELQ